jgi:hypothetical protein
MKHITYVSWLVTPKDVIGSGYQSDVIAVAGEMNCLRPISFPLLSWSLHHRDGVA